MKGKYEYNICTVADRRIYMKQKEALLKNVPSLREVKEIETEDNGLFSKMTSDYGELVLKNSEYINALWIESDFALEPFFE